MTLIEAMKKAKNNQRIERKKWVNKLIPGMIFTKHGEFFCPLPNTKGLTVKDLKANDWGIY